MDKRLKNIRISFPEGWSDISSQNPDGPPTFIHGRLEEPGVLQISIAQYVSGKKPNPDFTDLISLSEKIGLKNNFGQITHKVADNCKYGKYGKVEFAGSAFPYIAVWHLSNGKDFIFATFICSKIPVESEKNDVESILLSIRPKRFIF